MKKLLISGLVVLSSVASVSAFAQKVVIKHGCDNTGCHYTKKSVSHHHGKKIVNTVKCDNGHCVNVNKKIKHKDNGVVVTTKTVCNANGHHCHVTKTKKI
jgi:hypothetical protein